jgi:uncharacterized protein (DUF1778 family)
MQLDEDQKTLIAEFASLHGKSMAEFMLEAALDAIEDATDLQDWKAAKAEFDADPVTYTADEIAKKYL